MPTQSWGHSLSLWESWRWYGFVRRFSGRLAPEWSTRLPEIQARAWRNRSCSMVCALAEPWIWVLHPTEHKHRSCSTELFCSQEQNKTFFYPYRLCNYNSPEVYFYGIMHFPCIVSCELKQWKCFLKRLLWKYFPQMTTHQKRLFRHLHNMRYPSAQSCTFKSFFSK